MTCNEYRTHLQLHLHEMPAGPEGALRLHAAGCPACARFTQWLLSLDLALRDLPIAPVSPAVLESVRAIAHRPPPLPWRPDLLRTAASIVPAALLWSGRGLLPDPYPFLASAALAFAGAFIIVTAALRPRLLGPPV